MKHEIDRTPARKVREACRAGVWRSPTTGLAPGFVQANLVVLPKELAFEFLLFCQRNPKPCPVLDVTEPGDPEPAGVAPGADVRTDLPRYRIYRHGELVGEPTDLRADWRPDAVAFLLGCSFTFEGALLQAGLGVRHLEETTGDGQPKNVPMYRTNVPCRPAGRFRGPLVVSMRPYAAGDVSRAVAVTARYPSVHGAPVHVGNPAAIGIPDLARPDYGDPVTVGADEIPVFWACGVTPQAVVMESRLEQVLTHAPGHMLVCDLTDAEMSAT